MHRWNVRLSKVGERGNHSVGRAYRQTGVFHAFMTSDPAPLRSGRLTWRQHNGWRRDPWTQRRE